MESEMGGIAVMIAGSIAFGICIVRVWDAWRDERRAKKEWKLWQAAHSELKDNAKVQ